MIFIKYEKKTHAPLNTTITKIKLFHVKISYQNNNNCITICIPSKLHNTPNK